MILFLAKTDTRGYWCEKNMSIRSYFNFNFKHTFENRFQLEFLILKNNTLKWPKTHGKQKSTSIKPKKTCVYSIITFI